MAVSNPASQRPQVTVVDQDEQPWPHLETFFTTERDEDKGDNAYIATCSSCRPRIFFKFHHINLPNLKIIMTDPWDIRERHQMANLRSKQNKIKKALDERKAAEKTGETECKSGGSPPGSDNENCAEEYPGLWAVANHLSAKLHRKRFNWEKNEIAKLGRKMLKIKKARAKRNAPEIVGRQDKLKKALTEKKASENVNKQRGRTKNPEEIKDTKGSKPAGRPPGIKNKPKDTKSPKQNKSAESKIMKDGKPASKNIARVTKSELPIS